MPEPALIALPHHLARQPISLVVADIDGCLSAGSGSHFSHDLLARLARANNESLSDPAVPAVTLCTGRPQPYVECLLQAIHGHKPALCEGGTVFFDPVSHQIETHLRFGRREEQVLARLRGRVEERLVRPGIKPEPGKITHITLIVRPPDKPEDLYEEAVEIASEFGDEFVVELTRVCVHFLFREIHKGVGIDWLAEHTGIAAGHMAGIGDGSPDIPFLQRVGFAYAPGNADDRVKAVCHGVSRQADCGAALELLDMVTAHNRALKAAGAAATGAAAAERNAT